MSHPVILIAIGALAAFCAKKRGKNPWLWFFLGMFLWSFLGMLFGIFVLLFFVLSPSVAASASKRPRTQATNDRNTIDITPKIEPAAKETFWYYLDLDNNQKGPMSFDALIQVFRQGKISDRSYVWNETLQNWQRLGDFL